MVSSILDYPPDSTVFHRPQIYLRPSVLYSIRTFGLHSRRSLPGISQKGGVSLTVDSLNRRRSWSSVANSGYGFIVGDEDYDEEDDDEEDEDRSLDLLIRFVQNIFKKISRRARKAVRAVLPVPISSSLVTFSVNGVIILAFMWILKAFLEVLCTLGTVIFSSILLIRGVWVGLSYLQANNNNKMEDFDDDPRTWSGAQTVS